MPSFNASFQGANSRAVDPVSYELLVDLEKQLQDTIVERCENALLEVRHFYAAPGKRSFRMVTLFL